MSTPVAVNITATTTIIAAEEGETPIVFSYVLTASAAIVIKFTDTDDADLTGNIYFPTNGNVPAAYNPDGHFQAPAGKGIKIAFVSGSGTIGGHVSYHAY